MDVYVLETSFDDDMDSCRILFDSNDSAMYAAMDEVVDRINSQYDPKNPELMKAFDKVSDHIRSNDYNAALDAYNDLPDDFVNDYYHMYVTVYVADVNSQSKRKIMLTSEETVLSVSEVQVSSVLKEVPCPHCSRPNYVGVTQCWYCGNSI